MMFTIAAIQKAALYPDSSDAIPPTTTPAPTPTSHDVSIEEFAVPLRLFGARFTNIVCTAGNMWPLPLQRSPFLQRAGLRALISR